MITMIKNLKKARSIALLVVVTTVFPLAANAAGGGFALQEAGNDVGDVASLQRGARNFVNYCMGCHSAKYIRFSKLQETLQITDEQVQNNLMFAARSVDENMTIAMPSDDAERWFGQVPPDLTLVARSRGTAWIYTFLKSFYLDGQAATGSNNLVLPNASMPNVLWELQGLHSAGFATTENENGRKVEHFGDPAHFDGMTQETEGTLSPQKFDQFVRDLVNFLDWAGAPEQLQRRTLGIWVLIFLFVFLIFAYLLKVEIWKDVK